MACCDDPTQPPKTDRRALIRLQEQYGELVRDLFTEDPERVMLKLLQDCTPYLLELAALRAHSLTVRLRAISLLEQKSTSVLQRIADGDHDAACMAAARSRLADWGI